MFARVLLIATGALFAVVGGGLCWLFVAAFTTPGDSRPPAAFFLVALLFGSIGLYGLSLAVRGFRGSSRPRFERASAALLTHGCLFGLVTCTFMTCALVLQAGGPAALLLSRPRSPLPGLVFQLLLLLGVVPVHVALHELGHALMARAVGFRFESLQIGRSVFQREGGRVRFRRGPPVSPGILGMHFATPEGEKHLRARFVAWVAAGPITNFVLAAGCRAGVALLPVPATLGAALAARLLGAGWWMGLFLGALNLLPLRFRSGFETDGLQLLTALSRSPTALFRLRYRTLASQGVRPRDWKATAASLLAAARREAPHRDFLLLAALGVAADQGDRARCEEILAAAELAPLRSPILAFELGLQAAMLEAFWGNPAQARARLASLPPGQLTMREYPRLAEAAVSLAEGRHEDARASLAVWERATAASGSRASIRVGNEWAEEAIKARLLLFAQTSDPAVQQTTAEVAGT